MFSATLSAKPRCTNRQDGLVEVADVCPAVAKVRPIRDNRGQWDTDQFYNYTGEVPVMDVEW